MMIERKVSGVANVIKAFGEEFTENQRLKKTDIAVEYGFIHKSKEALIKYGAHIA